MAIALVERLPNQTGQGPSLGEVALLNEEPHRRQDVVRLGHWFAPGSVEGENVAISVVGARSIAERVQWSPYGRRWPDGSVKRAELIFPTELDPSEYRTVQIERGTHGRIPVGSWPTPDAELQAMQALRWRLIVNADDDAQNRADITAATPFDVLQNGYWLQRWRWRVRVPGHPYVSILEIDRKRGMDHSGFRFQWINSDNSIPDWFYRTEQNGHVLKVWGVEPVFRHDATHMQSWVRGPFGRNGFSPSNVADAFIGVLAAPGSDPDGGGGPWQVGTLLYGASTRTPGSIEASTVTAERGSPVKAISVGWPASGAVPPLGHCPPRPDWVNPSTSLESSRARAKELLAWRPTRLPDPFYNTDGGEVGLPARPGNTADKQDYRVMQFLAAMTEADPWWLYAAERACYMAGCRPHHYLEANMERIKLSDHQLLEFWNDRLWNNGRGNFSPDMLGKASGANTQLNPFANQTRYPQTGGGEFWFTNDREHDQKNLYIFWAMLTCDPFMRDYLQYCADTVWPAAYKPTAQNPTIRGGGAARGLGRGLDTAVKLYEITGHEPLKQNISDFVDHIWNERQAWLNGPQDVKTFAVNGPAGGNLDKTHTRPWEDGIALQGFIEAYELTQNGNAYQAMLNVGRTLALYGHHSPSTGVWRTYKAMAWNNGAFLSATQLSQFGEIGWVNGDQASIYRVWVFPAILYLRQVAIAENDSQWRDRCEEIISARLQEFRDLAPTDGRWDGMGESDWGHKYWEWTSIVQDAFGLGL